MTSTRRAKSAQSFEWKLKIILIFDQGIYIIKMLSGHPHAHSKFDNFHIRDEKLVIDFFLLTNSLVEIIN